MEKRSISESSLEASSDVSSLSLFDSETFDDESLKRSMSMFDVIFPVFALLGERVYPPTVYDVESNGVQLVCKYLKAYQEKKLDPLMKSEFGLMRKLL